MNQVLRTSTRGATVAQAGVLAVAVLLIVDVVADGALGGPAAAVLKGAALVGAVLAAGACYQTWGSADARTFALHAAAVLGLAGGASIAGAVFSPGDAVVFGDRTFAVVGVVGLLMSAVAIGRWRTELRDSR